MRNDLKLCGDCEVRKGFEKLFGRPPSFIWWDKTAENVKTALPLPSSVLHAFAVEYSTYSTA